MFYIPYAWLNIKKKLMMQWAIEKVRESDDGSSWKQMCARWKILWEVALYNRHSVFVKSTYNDTRGSGFDRVDTKNTKQAAWPWKNLLGKIISKVAKIKRKRKNWAMEPTAKQPQQSKESTKQPDTVKMLKDIRVHTDSDSFSMGLCWFRFQFWSSKPKRINPTKHGHDCDRTTNDKWTVYYSNNNVGFFPWKNFNYYQWM